MQVYSYSLVLRHRLRVFEFLSYHWKYVNSLLLLVQLFVDDLSFQKFSSEAQNCSNETCQPIYVIQLLEVSCSFKCVSLKMNEFLISHENGGKNFYKKKRVMANEFFHILRGMIRFKEKT